MSQIDSGDVSSNPSDNPVLSEILDAEVSRRGLLGGGLGAAAAAVVGGALVGGGAEALLDAVPAAATPSGPLLGFEAIPTSTADTVTVPPGYTAQTLISWGDPVSDGPAFEQDGSNTAAEQAQQWGMHNDGVVFFPIADTSLLGLPFLGPLLGGLLNSLLGGLLGLGGHSGRTSRRGIICENNEYTDDGLLFADGIASWTAEKSEKVLNAHGVSIIEVERRRSGEWKVVRPSRYGRRITGSTPIRLSGPAAGHDLLKTNADPTGREVLGTLNNCAMGYTPWGTYLTCEENFNGFFRKGTVTLDPLETRYGIGASGTGDRLASTHARFNLEQERHEPNRFGWVVEINPFAPRSTPVKRTALGRIKHEGAWVQETKDGKVVVYMGDDQVFEYVYRYVSRLPWRQSFARGIHPLDDGTLYVARFDAGGTGAWIPLTPDHPALSTWTLPEILIRTRQAADLVGPTKMDRPEWIDTFPHALTTIATLTNNSSRASGTNPGVDAANPRAAGTNTPTSPGARYGMILQWSYAHDFDEPDFAWSHFALCGDPSLPGNPNGSTINGDKYGSPDGLYVAPSGRLWIQTDVSTSTLNVAGQAYDGYGNNMMLCADPTTKETRRFLVGPKQCEITGCFATPDERTLFVGIQHPGERPDDSPTPPDQTHLWSTWPDGPSGGRPRSSLLAITKDDGGVVGS